MNFLSRLRAMVHLGDALGRLTTRSVTARVEREDAARQARIGDIDGQTARAQAFAAELDGLTIK